MGLFDDLDPEPAPPAPAPAPVGGGTLLADLDPAGPRRVAPLAVARVQRGDGDRTQPGEAQPSPPLTWGDEIGNALGYGHDSRSMVGRAVNSPAGEMAGQLAPWVMGPLGVGAAVGGDSADRYQDMRKRGFGVLASAIGGGAQGAVELGSGGLAKAALGRPAAAIGGALADRLGGRLGNAAADAAEHGIVGAGTGEAMALGSAGVSLATGDRQRAAQEAAGAWKQGLGLGALGAAVGGATGFLRAPGGLFAGIDPATTGEAPAATLARARQDIAPDFAEDPITTDQGSTVSGFNTDRPDQLNADLGIAPRGTTLAAARAKRYPAGGGLSLTNPVALRGRAAFIEDAAPRPNPPGGEATPIMGASVLPEVANGIQAPDSANGSDVPGEATGAQPGVARAALRPDQPGAVPPVLEPARGDAPPIVRAPDAGGVAVPAVPPVGAPAEGRGADAPVAGGLKTRESIPAERVNSYGKVNTTDGRYTGARAEDAGPVLYRETDPARADELINPGTSSRVPFGQGSDVFFANKPELALGQGSNRGVRVEMDSAGLVGKYRQKPGLIGDNREIAIPSNLLEESKGNVRAVTLTPGAGKTDPGSYVRLRRMLDQRVATEGWTKSKTAEGVRYERPTAEAPAAKAPSAAEAPTPIMGNRVLENRDAGRGGRGAGDARGEAAPAPDRAVRPPVPAEAGRSDRPALVEPGRAAVEPVGRSTGGAVPPERPAPPPSAGAADLAHLSPAARDYVAGLAPSERALAQSSIDHLRTHPDPRGDVGNLKMVVESGARRAARKVLGNPAAPAAAAAPTAPRPDPIGKQLWGERSFIGQDAVPTALEARKGIREALTDVQRVLAPQTRGAQAKTAGGIAREHGAELAQRTDRAVHALETARRYFQGQDKAVGLDFIDRIETGRVQATPGMAAFAETIRTALDTRRQEIQALGKGKLAHFIEDYFPHLWKDPAKAGSVFGQAIGKRPLEGAKSFLKKRSIPTIKEGIAAGLEPVSDNPIDLVLLKAREMDKYLLGQRMLAELKTKDLARYVKATDSAPEGFAKINDPIASVYGAPTVKLAEHVDPAVYNVLEGVLRDLGITHVRKESIGAGKLGESIQGGDEIRTRNASPMGTIAHELGHQIDHKLGLGKILARPELDAETAAIADLHDRLPDYFRTPEERTASVLEAYIQAKERMREIAPKTLDALETFIDQHPKLAPLKDIRPSLGDRKLDYEKAHGGLLKMGEYYAPEPVANLLNNYLSPGLRGKSAAFRAFLGVGNVLNQAQLGMSAFHLGFTSFDSASSKWAIAAKWLAAGHPLKALAHFAEAPLAPVSNALRGSKVLREWMKPGSEGAEIGKIVDAMKAAGGRAKMDAFYHTAAAQKMMDAFRSGNLLGGMLRVVPGTIDLLAKPIMEYVVPRQKLGIFYDMARLEMAKLKPEASRDDLRAAMGKAWDSVDNRMGQLVYDNLFWNKTAKDLAMASVRSVGWNLGTWRELGGGAIDSAKFAADLMRGKRPEMTHRMAYALMMPAFAGTVGAMVGYLYGQPPKELKDYFFPRTGEKDEKGHDIRLSLPSYMKDVYHIAHDPVGAVTGKAHPALSMISDMLRNKDFFGAKIRNEDDPLTQQALDLAKYAGKQLVPMGISNASDQNLKPGEKAAAFVGVVRAPKYLSQSKAEMLAQSIASESFKGEPKTPEQRQHDLDLLRLLRSPKPEDQKQGMAQMEKEMRAGTMSRAAARAIHAQSTSSNLEHQLRGLSAIDSVRVWRIATPDERAHIRQEILAKIAQSKSLTTAKRIALAEEVQPGIVNGRAGK